MGFRVHLSLTALIKERKKFNAVSVWCASGFLDSMLKVLYCVIDPRHIVIWTIGIFLQKNIHKVHER